MENKAHRQNAVKADLHIHSCLSPCGSLEMSPRRIVQEAKKKGLDVIALTDHNCTLNLPAFDTVCRQEGLTALFGLEANTREEIHVLCLFGEIETAMEAGQKIYDLLPPVICDPERWGDQVYVDENEIIIGEVEKLLINAADISLEELMELTFHLGGMFIPAHIHRPYTSILSQLGFLPQLPYSALECRRGEDQFGYKNVIHSSDAHYPDDIGCRFCEIFCEKPDFEGIKDALKKGWVK